MREQKSNRSGATCTYEQFGISRALSGICLNCYKAEDKGLDSYQDCNAVVMLVMKGGTMCKAAVSKGNCR